MEKTCAKFKNDQYKTEWGVALTRYPLSIHFHRIWDQKMTKFTKWKVTKIKARIISKPHAHLQTMEKTCAKFQKGRYKIVWGVALTRYPLSIHWGWKMTKFTKWKKVTKNNLTKISKPHAHPHIMTNKNTCKVSRWSVQNCKRSCAHKTPRVNVDRWMDGRTETCMPKSPMLKQVRQKDLPTYPLWNWWVGAQKTKNFLWMAWGKAVSLKNLYLNWHKIVCHATSTQCLLARHMFNVNQLQNS